LPTSKVIPLWGYGGKLEKKRNFQINTMKKPMHQFAKPSTFGNAKRLRYVQTTEAELKLWEAIRNKKLGVKFRRQHPISVFILDFYCHEAQLVIELDGKYHSQFLQKLYDENRSQFLKDIGLHELRFKNEDVINK
jgi:very-short-patch-repair endonuclease